MPKHNNLQLVGRLWKQISAKRRAQLGLLFVLMVLTSFAEVLSISAVLPFLSALMQPEVIFGHAAAQPLIGVLGIDRPDELILPLTISFCVATVLAAIMRVLLLWTSTRLSFALGSDLSNRIYRNTLYQPYSIHIARNSSEVVSVVWGKVSEIIFFIIVPMMVLISSCISITVICVVLLLTVPTIALVAIGCLAAVYVSIVLATKRRLKHNSQVIARESSNLVKALQEGMGGIRDILINGSQEAFSKSYWEINKVLRKAQGTNQIMGGSPRYIVESLGMLLIAVLAYTLSKQPTGMASAIPQMAAIALGLQRLLPSAQQLYNSWSNIHGAQASLLDVLAMAEQLTEEDLPRDSDDLLAFRRDIVLKRVSFRYSENSSWVLKDISLVIQRGSHIGFVGTTGAGKSTLLDIILGLLDPVEGCLEVDGEIITDVNKSAWQAHIAHVPQAIFLSDSSVAENIAFGISSEEIDLGRVRYAAQQAQLADIIESWPNGYKTRVGERGVQLSGGQRQRIGLARALYRRADVIVLDEATSALDNETEEAVMRAIDALNPEITVLIIAHRLNTLANCTKIVEFTKGGVTVRDRVDVENTIR